MLRRAPVLVPILVLVLCSCSDDTPPAADLAAPSDALLDRGSGEQRGDSGASCDAIKAALAVQVELAKVCQPQSSSKQCTRTISQDQLPCGCPVFVNPGNGDAIKQIDELLSTWRRKGCGAGIDCKSCATPSSGSCEATPAGSKVPGLCKSMR
jgi:hypothetical protein